MKNTKIYFLAMTTVVTLILSCKKNDSSTLESSNALIQQNNKRANDTQNNTVNSTEYIYIVNTGTIYGQSLDPVDNWDTFRVYQEGSNRNLRIIWEARSVSKPTGKLELVGPGSCFIHAYPNYFFDYSLENEYMTTGVGAVQTTVIHKEYNIKIKKVIDFDTQEDITSQVSIFPSEGIKVQYTKQILGGGEGPGQPSTPKSK
ncbi:hypothetical protein [Pedobacter nototheniae]|uniref:hypothetical protein n=1 Tax=Pedobacter nototheniae TaxID=2488994 RepID=UPI00103B3723|nr:hypothetical protein [Pedobacter nototheniae]